MAEAEEALAFEAQMEAKYELDGTTDDLERMNESWREESSTLTNPEDIKRLRDEKRRIEAEYQEKQAVHIAAKAKTTQARAKRLNISEADAIVRKTFPENHPAVQRELVRATENVTGGVQRLMKKNGEKIKVNPETGQAELPTQTKKEVEKAWHDYVPGTKALVTVTLLGTVAAAIMQLSLNGWDYFNKNPDPSQLIPVGCYQYHVNSGAVKALGVCGAQEQCTALTDSASCKAAAPCDWILDASGNGSCKVGSQITQADSCCNKCSSDGDCHTFANPPGCQTDSDCKIGNCVGNVCKDQSCDPDTKTCGPCPSLDNTYSMLQQVTSGKLGFCHAIGTGVLEACPAASLICAPQNPDKTGGACRPCSVDDGYCQDPGGVNKLSPKDTTCMCVSVDPTDATKFVAHKDWIVIPTCTSNSDIFESLLYLGQITDQWAPPETPWYTTGLVVVGLLSFAVTFVWFILRLIKQGSLLRAK